MSDQQPEVDWQQQLDELRDRADSSDAAIESLQDDAARARDRADASEVRADTAEFRADTQENRADANHRRIARLEERADVDQTLIAALRADGIISTEHAAHLEEALAASRKIGAAIGIIMAHRKINETDAFSVLVNGSQNANRKLRVLAAEVVDTGDVSQLPDL